MALICVSLITNDVEYFLCTYLPPIYLLRWSVHPNLLLIFYWAACFLIIGSKSFFIYSSPLLDMGFCKNSLPVYGFPFHPLTVSLKEQQFLILMKFHLSIFFPFWIVFLVLYWRIICLSSQRFSSKFSPGIFIIFNFTFRWVIHFKLYREFFYI